MKIEVADFVVTQSSLKFGWMTVLSSLQQLQSLVVSSQDGNRRIDSLYSLEKSKLPDLRPNYEVVERVDLQYGEHFSYLLPMFQYLAHFLNSCSALQSTLSQMTIK